MANDTGGITLKIDAETAGFIAQISNAAAHSKKLHEGPKEAGEHMHKLTEFTRDFASEVAGVAAPLGVAGALIMSAASGVESWKRNLEDTEKVLTRVTDLHRALARVGLGKEAEEYTKIMHEAGPSLKPEQLPAVFGAITAPGGFSDTSSKDFKQIVERQIKQADMANKAGLDPTEFAGINARLDSSGVQQSQELSHYAMTQIGAENREQAITSAIEAPDEAIGILQTYAGASRTPGKGVKGVLNKLMGDWLAHGKKGSFHDFINSGTARRLVGREGKGYLDVLRKAPHPNIRPRELEEGVHAVEVGSPNLKTETAGQAMDNEDDEIKVQQFGEKTEELKLDAKRATTAHDAAGGADIFPNFGWTPLKNLNTDITTMFSPNSGELGDYARYGGQQTLKDYRAHPNPEGQARKQHQADSLKMMQAAFDFMTMGPGGNGGKDVKAVEDILLRQKIKPNAQGEHAP
jgi:hypothetical protein